MDIMMEEDFSTLRFEKKNGLWYIHAKDPGDAEYQMLDPSTHGYHRVISCLGWRFDASLFDASVAPNVTGPAGYASKYPLLNPRFESATVPRLFFVGTMMHSNDFKKASGGFIHGFRYLIRALHRVF